MLTWLEQHMLPCASKSLFGIDCPACGIQRSMIQLMRGELVNSFSLYPPLIPVLSLVLLTAIHLLSETLITGKFLKAYAVAVLLLVFVNYFFKLFLL